MAADDDMPQFEDLGRVPMSLGNHVNFAIGDQKFIGYPTNANNVSL